MVRSGILGGLGHSDSRVEFGSCVFGHLERGMAKSGKRGHRTGWGHPNSHIRFVPAIGRGSFVSDGVKSSKILELGSVDTIPVPTRGKIR